MDRQDTYWGPEEKLSPRTLDTDELMMTARLRQLKAAVLQAAADIRGCGETLDDWGPDCVDAAQTLHGVADDIEAALSSTIWAGAERTAIDLIADAIKDIERLPEIEAERAEDDRACGEVWR